MSRCRCSGKLDLGRVVVLFVPLVLKLQHHLVSSPPESGGNCRPTSSQTPPKPRQTNKSASLSSTLRSDFFLVCLFAVSWRTNNCSISHPIFFSVQTIKAQPPRTRVCEDGVCAPVRGFWAHSSSHHQQYMRPVIISMLHRLL